MLIAKLDPHSSLSDHGHALLAELLVLAYGLACLEQSADEIGLRPSSLPDAEARVFQVDPDVEDYAVALHKRFIALNESVWRAEEPLEAESVSNKPVRELGVHMHLWYENWKFRAAFRCGFMIGSDQWPIQPYFKELFQEGLERSSKGDAIAKDLMYRNWGVLPDDSPETVKAAMNEVREQIRRNQQ